MIRSHFVVCLCCVLALVTLFQAHGSLSESGEAGWISLFDGKTLDGWAASENKESCRVEDGMIVVGGERSHLFYEGPVEDHNFTDFELKLEVKTTPGSNSGVFFHTEYQETDWPKKGYEAQVNNSHTDWRRTGSIYAAKDVRKTAAVDDEWFEYHIIVSGKTVTVKVNGEIVNEYTETEDTPPPADRPNRVFSSGTIALQAHDPGSTVYYRNIRIKTPASEAAEQTPLVMEAPVEVEESSIAVEAPAEIEVENPSDLSMVVEAPIEVSQPCQAEAAPAKCCKPCCQKKCKRRLLRRCCRR